MNHLFQQATERYKAVSQELRAMTGEIQRELETTRQELRRGAMELPRETSEQTAAMRRVVAEQIKALNELTDIVARSGRMYDVSEPIAGPRTEASSAPRRETRPEAPARRPEPPRETRFDARPAATRAQTPAAPYASSTVSYASPAPTSGERGSGWMSDLLARASVDEPPARRASADPLDNLSADIVRMIDENAMVDAWDRFRRGDRTAFSRRLYTAQGVKTFEEVRRRYGAETDFRGAVDRYLAEFERLMADIDRQDHDGQTTRNYLVSETGKAYTMLAHAAGRLG
jgi:hypothetical protein